MRKRFSIRMQIPLQQSRCFFPSREAALEIVISPFSKADNYGEAYTKPFRLRVFLFLICRQGYIFRYENVFPTTFDKTIPFQQLNRFRR